MVTTTPVKPQYTVCNDPPGLVFNTVNILEVVEDPALSQLFPTGFYATVQECKSPRYVRYYQTDYKPKYDRTVITLVSLTDDPDKATHDTAPSILHVNGVTHQINLRTKYNACTSLFKMAACSECPDNGLPCVREYLKLPETTHVPRIDTEDLLASVEALHLDIAGHAYVSPSHTRYKAISAKLRPYWEHRFDFVEENIRNASRRATDAAETRSFKKKECTKCVVANRCFREKHCTGAYPSQDEIIATCTAELDDAISRSELTPWQIYELGRNVDARAKHSRYQLVLAGLEIHRDVLGPAIYRAKTNIATYPHLKTYNAIAEVFGLAKTETEVTTPPNTDQLLRAVWWLTMKLPRHASSRGWGTGESGHLGAGLAAYHVNTVITGDRYLHGTVQYTELHHTARNGHLPSIIRNTDVRE